MPNRKSGGCRCCGTPGHPCAICPSLPDTLYYTSTSAIIDQRQLTFSWGDPPAGGPYGPGGNLGPYPAQKRWWTGFYTNRQPNQGGDRIRLGYIGCEQFRITFRVLERNPTSGAWGEGQTPVASWGIDPQNTCSPLALTVQLESPTFNTQAKLYGSMPPGFGTGTGTTSGALVEGDDGLVDGEDDGAFME